MIGKIISAALVLGVAVWLYLAVAYLKNKRGGGCDSAGCSGCAMRGECGKNQKEDTDTDMM